ncbi:endonuclease/exonuclease/phosphatase [Myxococcus stipitatus DSM 14675]|uniref:Endonuclease/exonuclease/phosphatase n=1 Tax=Myxococcus stipitatus (strain DSM 14675 / JCM 12634 / Mx s8) TaxID=1278073 RepID=L7UND1_MYXSD|nr:endonuclease/exonuclease/phosphatase [Myxococcus stipitatus]AGC47954.1 endonuclease/exonuclease/phosphatase [Myxococcus stipitatus DSM 14675]
MTTTRTGTPARWSLLRVALTAVLTSTSALAADEVRLLEAVSTVSSYRGNTWQDVTYLLVVKNLAYEKQVVIHDKQPDGSWLDLSASYVGGAGAGQELWKVTRQYPSWGTAPQPTRDLEFVARLTVNGQTYWDNNAGANYHLGRADGPLLPRVNVLVATSVWQSNGDVDIGIDVKNLAYSKSVTVVYSTDDWATSHEVAASFVPGYSVGYASVASPNAQNVERWQARIPPGSGTPRYYIRYQVGGQTYWDSHFGQNYPPIYPPL